MEKAGVKPLPKLIFKEPRKETIKVLKNKGELFEAVMNAIGDLVSIQDLDMTITYQNKAIKEVMGDHYGMHCYRIYERRDNICEGCPMQESFKTGKVARTLRTGISKEGVAGRYELITAPLKDKQGRVVAGIEVVRDVTERENVLAELKNKTEELEKFIKLATGRELTMVELKKEIEKLKKELEKYKPA